MIYVIRMLTDCDPKKMWASIIEQKESLQHTLVNKGQLMYLSKRANHNEVNLFVHSFDSNILTDLLINHLGVIKEVSDISIYQLFRPRFFPIPKDNSDMKHCIVDIKVKPQHFTEVYKKLLNPNVPEGIRKVYYAFVFQQNGGDMQYSLLANDEDKMQKFVTENICAIEGVVRTEVYMIEKTKPFISYKEWMEYTKVANLIPAWNRYMENHFSFEE